MTAVCARPVVDVWGELREIGEAMRHCQASYAHTFTSTAHRCVIARYYASLNRQATALSCR